MEPSNPVDLWPAVEKNGMDLVYTRAIDTIMHDENVDSIIVHIFSERIASDRFRPLGTMKEKFAKPVVAWVTGTGERFHTFRKDLEAMGIPVFEEMGRGVSFLSAVKEHFRKKAALKEHELR
jgi:acetyltransferase